MLKITKYNIPSIMSDNDMQMFNLLFKVVEKIDKDAKIDIFKSLKGYKIVVSANFGRELIIQELRELSFILGDVFEFSTTINFAKNITFFTK